MCVQRPPEPWLARHLAPRNVERIGILGGGVQARLQLKFLLPLISCRRVVAWMHDPSEVDPYQQYFADADLEVEIVGTSEEVADRCNLIVTATPSKTPLLPADRIRAGTHITAIGSDTVDKIELDTKILGDADLVVVDSLASIGERGEVFRQWRQGRCSASPWSSSEPSLRVGLPDARTTTRSRCVI